MAESKVADNHFAPTHTNSISLLRNPFPEFPSTTLSAPYTFQEDGWVSLCAQRNNQGYTLYILIDGLLVFEFPAHVAPLEADVMFPVRKGQSMTMRTDGNNTWIIRNIRFIT